MIVRCIDMTQYMHTLYNMQNKSVAISGHKRTCAVKQHWPSNYYQGDDRESIRILLFFIGTCKDLSGFYKDI